MFCTDKIDITHAQFWAKYDNPIFLETMADKAAALKEKLANLKRKRQEAKTANHRDVCKNNL